MKKRKTSVKTNLLSAARIFLLLLAVSILPSMQAQAASQKTKALKAYKKLLSQGKTPWEESTPMSGSQFAIVYLDNNNVPELIIKNENVPRYARPGRLYTYAKGKVVEVGILYLDKLDKVMDKSPFSYYKKTGIYGYGCYEMGYCTKNYYKMSGTKSSHTGLTNTYYTSDYYNSSYRNKVEYKVNNKTASKSAFTKKLKKLTKSKKVTTPKFYKNTKANRNRYLK